MDRAEPDRLLFVNCSVLREIQWLRCSAVCKQSSARPSDATSTSGRPFVSEAHTLVSQQPLYWLSVPQPELQVSFSPGLFSDVFRFHASMALWLDSGDPPELIFFW